MAKVSNGYDWSLFALQEITPERMVQWCLQSSSSVYQIGLIRSEDLVLMHHKLPTVFRTKIRNVF